MTAAEHERKAEHLEMFGIKRALSERHRFLARMLRQEEADALAEHGGCA